MQATSQDVNLQHISRCPFKCCINRLEVFLTLSHVPLFEYLFTLHQPLWSKGNIVTSHADRPGFDHRSGQFPGWGFSGGFPSTVRQMSAHLGHIRPRLSYGHHISLVGCNSGTTKEIKLWDKWVQSFALYITKHWVQQRHFCQLLMEYCTTKYATVAAGRKNNLQCWRAY